MTDRDATYRPDAIALPRWMDWGVVAIAAGASIAFFATGEVLGGVLAAALALVLTILAVFFWRSSWMRGTRRDLTEPVTFGFTMIAALIFIALGVWRLVSDSQPVLGGALIALGLLQLLVFGTIPFRERARNRRR